MKRILTSVPPLVMSCFLIAQNVGIGNFTGLSIAGRSNEAVGSKAMQENIIGERNTAVSQQQQIDDLKTIVTSLKNKLQ